MSPVAAGRVVSVAVHAGNEVLAAVDLSLPCFLFFLLLLLHYYKRRRCEQAISAPDDRLTALHDDLLISILSFLSNRQRVALSAVCSRFHRLLPSIPRVDTFCIVDQGFTFPHSLIRQCRVVFGDVPKHLEQLLVDDLVEAGVQDLIIETREGTSFCLRVREKSGFFGIKSLRSLSLSRIGVGIYGGFPVQPIALPLLTSLKIERCLIFHKEFLPAFLAACPFLETLHFISCHELYQSNKCIHSASIKHLVLSDSPYKMSTIHLRCPNLESLTVDVVAELRIEAPKLRNASFLVRLRSQADPPDALKKFLGAAAAFLPSTSALLMLNSSTTPNILAEKNGIDRFISSNFQKNSVIFNLDLNLQDRSSAMLLSQLLDKYSVYCNISVDPTHIQQNTVNKIARDDRLLHGSTDVVELIKFRMVMPEKTFEGFLSNQEEMKEELRQVGLQMLKSRTSREQFNSVLASNEFRVEVSSSITNCIEMKF